MAKKLKQIGTIEHVSGATIPLLFNPNERCDDAFMFSAEFADMRWKNKSADDLRREVCAYLDSCAALNWIQVIEVKETSPFHSLNPMKYVGLEIDRYYIGLSFELMKNGQRKVRKLDWDDYAPQEHSLGYTSELSPDMNRIRSSTSYHMFHGSENLVAELPFEHQGHDGHYFVIGYSAEKWEALQLIQDGIGRLKVLLRELIGTTAGHARMAEAGSMIMKLLPEGPTTPWATPEQMKRHESQPLEFTEEERGD